MKKLSLVMCAIAMIGVCFSSCKKDEAGGGGSDAPIIDNVVENGFYIVGEATGFANLQASGVADCQMAIGINEAAQPKAPREGMYEKYIILKGGKEFSIVEKKGGENATYTASLEKKDIKTDAEDIKDGYWGKISAGTAAMKVEKDGMYHIVMDLNLDKQLDATGGAQIVIVPIEWGLRGDMNGWNDWTKFQEVSQDGLTWTWKNQEMPKDSAKFKFVHGKIWKIVLDDAEQVRAEVSLGKEMAAGGDDIQVGEKGIYEFTLTFKMAKGDIKNSFKYTAKRTGDIAVKDYSNVELELVGEAVADQPGATPDASSWAWGNVYPLGKPTKAGDVYTWKSAGKVKLVGGKAYKVRTKGFEAQGDIQAFDNGADIAVAADTEAEIVVTLNAVDGKMEVNDGSVAPELEYVAGRVLVEDKTGQEKIALYGWSPANGDNNDILGAWPGLVESAKVTVDGVEYKEFKYTKGIKDAEYKFIVNNNNGGWQTGDEEWTVKVTGADIKLIAKDDKTLSVK